MKYITKFAIKTVKFALNLFILFSFYYNSLCCFCFSEHRKSKNHSFLFLIFITAAFSWAKRSAKAHNPLNFSLYKLPQTAVYQRFRLLISGTQKAHFFHFLRAFSLISVCFCGIIKVLKNKVYQRFQRF